jgi:hypothetical protein
MTKEKPQNRAWSGNQVPAIREKTLMVIKQSCINKITL